MASAEITSSATLVPAAPNSSAPCSATTDLNDAVITSPSSPPATDVAVPNASAPSSGTEGPNAAVITGPSSTPATAVPNGSTSSSTTVDLAAFLAALETEELKAVQDYINKKNADNAKWKNTENTEKKKKRSGFGRKKQGRGFLWAWREEPDDDEIGVATLPQCYAEIKNLVEIDKSPNPVYAKALEEWSKKETLFTNRVERKKKKVANLKNEIYQLIGYFSVFQGVLLTAVAQSNLLHCNNWWSPILLSVVASVVTIFGVSQKLMQIKAFQKTVHSEERPLKVVINRLNTLRRKGVQKFKFAEFLNKKPKNRSTHRFWIYFWLVIGSLVVFTAGFPLSYWRILCHPDLKLQSITLCGGVKNGDREECHH